MINYSWKWSKSDFSFVPMKQYIRDESSLSCEKFHPMMTDTFPSNPRKSRGDFPLAAAPLICISGARAAWQEQTFCLRIDAAGKPFPRLACMNGGEKNRKAQFYTRDVDERETKHMLEISMYNIHTRIQSKTAKSTSKIVEPTSKIRVESAQSISSFFFNLMI